MKRWVAIALSILTIYILISMYGVYVSDKDIDTCFHDLLQKHHIDPQILDGIEGYSCFTASFTHVYGEILCDGMKAIWKLAKEHNISTFYDMGCGVGKALLMGKLLGFNTCIGIEDVSHRVKQAKLLKSKLPGDISSHMHIIHGNMLTYDYTQWQEPYLIFASNVMWDNTTNTAFFKMVARQFPPGTLLVVSKVYANDDTIISTKYEHMDTLIIPMSWDVKAQSDVLRII